MSNFLETKSYTFIDNYIIARDDNNVIDNIELLNLNFQPENYLFEGFDKLDFTTKKQDYNFNKILFHLNYGILLIHTNTYFDKESRDGVDLSREYNSLKLINLKSNIYKSIFSNEPGFYHGIVICELYKKDVLTFHCFDNLFISNLFDNKYIVICHLESKNFKENLILIKSEKGRLSELLSESNLFSIYDYDLKTLASKVTFYEIIEIISFTNQNVNSLFGIFKTYRNLIKSDKE